GGLPTPRSARGGPGCHPRRGLLTDVYLAPASLQLRGEALQLRREAREMVREGITHLTQEHEPDNRYFDRQQRQQHVGHHRLPSWALARFTLTRSCAPQVLRAHDRETTTARWPGESFTSPSARAGPRCRGSIRSCGPLGRTWWSGG